MTKPPPKMQEPAVPRHVAIVMDGNGRWAKQRGRPRAYGHQAGRRAARKIVRTAHEHGVQALTLFAFSQENWKRPPLEVSLLMELFVRTLTREVAALHKNQVRMRFIGDHRDFPEKLRKLMAHSEAKTARNEGLRLYIAAGYGGQWDVAQAAQQLCAQGLPITPENLDARVATAGVPHPDLLIRTGGEKRLSNFMLWQLAYAELCFVDTLWPDFGETEFAQALDWYAQRERRFGRVPEAT